MMAEVKLGSLVKIVPPLAAGDAPEMMGIIESITKAYDGRYLCTVLLNDGTREYCRFNDLRLVNTWDQAP